MPGVVDNRANELTNLRGQSQTILSSGSNQADQLLRSEKHSAAVEVKSATGFQSIRVQSPLQLYFSDATLSMMVDCFSP